MVSRFMSLSRGLLLLFVRVSFLLTASLFVICSLLGDMEYGLGLRTGALQDFELSATLFPLIRSYRSGPAYSIISREDPTHIPLILQALRYDPYAADLWYGLARMQLKSGNSPGYTAALTQLRTLTPDLQYQVVAGH